MPVASRAQVAAFLHVFKSCFRLDRFSVKDRQKNRQALIALAMAPAERRDALLGLQPDDYVAGPKPDDTDDTREVWEFGRTIGTTEVYIKVRVVQDPKKKNVHHAVVWSFHPAEFRMKYPLRGGSGS